MSGGGPGRRLRAAARPSLGLALTALGVLVGVGAVLVERNQGDTADRRQVRACTTEAVRAAARRQARSRQTHVARRPISSHASVTATEAIPEGGGKVTVTASAEGRRVLVVRAVVTATGHGVVVLRERARACALDSGHNEAAFSASIEAKRRAQARAERRGGTEARRRARRDARTRGQADARRRAQARLDRSVPTEQAELDRDTREDARRKARADARRQAAEAEAP